jgi:dihydrofolate reductase
MPKVIYYVAASLDGHIADAEGKVDWLHQYEDPQNDYGYEKFYECIDAVIMGSKTYMDIHSFGTGWVYPDVEAVVLTRQSDLPTFEDATIRFAQGDVKTIVDEMKTRLVNDIWLVGGGDIAAQMLAAKVLDEIQLTTMPMLLGEGTPFFPVLSAQYPLQMTAHKVWDNGVIQATYRVKWE